MQQPNVSVVIPIRNEASHIHRFLKCVSDFDESGFVPEYLFIDGLSTDVTKQLLEDFATKDKAKYRVLTNPAKQKPHALNLGIQEARGAVVVRLDAHSVYPNDYLLRLVKLSEETGAANVGGSRETVIEGNFSQRVISRLIGHFFAAGNAEYRTSQKKAVRQVDTVFGGCFRRDIFNKIGVFNERLLRTQDRELNFRICESGEKIMMDPSICCFYIPRSNLQAYLSWTFDGAFWLFRSPRFTSTRMFRLRNFIPFCFVLWVILFLICLSLDKLFLVFIFGAGCLIYGLLNLYFSVILAKQEKLLVGAPLVMLYFFLTHFAYGLGSLVGLIDRFVLRMKIE